MYPPFSSHCSSFSFFFSCSAPNSVTDFIGWNCQPELEILPLAPMSLLEPLLVFLGQYGLPSSTIPLEWQRNPIAIEVFHFIVASIVILSITTLIQLFLWTWSIIFKVENLPQRDINSFFSHLSTQPSEAEQATGKKKLPGWLIMAQMEREREEEEEKERLRLASLENWKKWQRKKKLEKNGKGKKISYFEEKQSSTTFWECVTSDVQGSAAFLEWLETSGADPTLAFFAGRGTNCTTYSISHFGIFLSYRPRQIEARTRQSSRCDWRRSW